jgi:hypothetical protein
MITGHRGVHGKGKIIKPCILVDNKHCRNVLKCVQIKYQLQIY